jgi:hypothetical protein
MAVKLQHNLEEDYSFQALVKTGANLEATLSPYIKDMKGFTKNNVLIVWGGSKDISRNETDKA